MKKLKRKFIIRRILFVVFLVLLLILIFERFFGSFFVKALNKIEDIVSINASGDNSGYSVIKQDFNSNYSGVGQESVSGMDGYFTTFTTVEEHEKTYKEYKQNGNSSWAKNKYWDATMTESGCGITAISIILSGYGFDYTPEDLRKMYYPVLKGDLIPKELSNTFGISNSDFLYDDYHLSTDYIKEYLLSNRPVLVCVWTEPTVNRWTTASHYMVLLACDGNDMVYVSNPNGLENSSKSSGWYDFDEIIPYVAKALFVEKY